MNATKVAEFVFHYAENFRTSCYVCCLPHSFGFNVMLFRKYIMPMVLNDIAIINIGKSEQITY